MIKTCDWAVDIHTPTRGGRYVPIANLPHPRLGDPHAKAEAMAHAFGSGWIMRTDTNFYVADGILCVEATRAGVPCFTFETGEGGRLEEEVVDGGAGFIRNVMKWLKMINGDAGSPLVARIGEKGYLWVRVTSKGVPNHGAHVHLGENAIERLLAALTPILALRDLPCPLPEGIARTIRDAKPISEPLSGVGEAETLSHITVNLGQIAGGLNINTIPDSAVALLDIRLPPGVTIEDVQTRVAAALDPLHGIEWEVLSECEPNWTDPDHELVRLIRENARAATGQDVAVNLRPGFSDARFYRQHGVPSVVYGVAANNMGGADEYATIEDLRAVFAVHTLTAFDYLSAES